LVVPFEMLEHAPVPAYAFRAEGDEFVLEAVNAVGRALNPSISVLIGKPMAGLYRDQPDVLAHANRAIAQRVTVTAELTMRRYDRTEATQPLRLTFAPVPPSHLLIFVQDVATPVTAQTALRESEARYRSVVASLPDGLVLRAADGRVLALNDVAVRLLGAKSQADLMGKTEVLADRIRVTTESGEPVDEEHLAGRRVLATGQAEVGQAFALISEERTVWVRVAAQPIHSTTGAVTGSVTTYTDITERVTAQRAQREAAARLDLALTVARMGVWEWEPESDTGWWSDNLGEIFSIPRIRPTTPALAEFVHPDDRSEFNERRKTSKAAPDGYSFEYEFRVVGTDGVTRWARAQGRLSQESGRSRVLGTLTDITEHNRLEEELRRAHRLESIGRLAGGIAHDFNNLLAAMMGSLELLEDQCPPSAKEDLATVQHGAMRARDLTKQLLAFARKQPIEFKLLDLSAMVIKVERLLRRLVGQNIEMVISGDDPVWVRGDASSLEQVLVNLVVNASEAMPNGGRLDVFVGRNSDHAMLEVIDSGIGMNDETRRKVFDPFFTTKTHGTGLGLASSYGIAKQHGGDIVVESEPGRGTRFRVMLPRLPESIRAAAQETAPVTPAVKKGCVLVIDDEPLVRTTTIRLLQTLGYDVLSAGGAAEAVVRSREHQGPIDFLVCDIAMPGRSGPSVAAELAASRPLLKVIFASGYAEGDHNTELHNSTFLQKPYTMAELAAKLTELASR
jgi:PAS domain S-box-containing protein